MARLVWGFGLTLVAGSAAAQSPPADWFKDSVTVVPGAHYRKGAVHRFFFGDHYRDLWTTPIRVPVLDLQKFAGGLKPTEKGGGQQTTSLRLDGADGRQYQFRSVDKDPSAALPPGLRNTFADDLFQDQMSAGHPAGALIAPPILEAADVLHPKPILVVMPDDPALGEFRVEFANLLGTIEERPRNPEGEDEVPFAGAEEIQDTEDMLDAVENNPLVRVDSRELLTARLTDVFMGDWDRHQDQWRWARLKEEGHEHWHPIPRDRDQAFVKFDGLLLKAVRAAVPQLVKFGPNYPKMEAATWNGRDLDRRFLTNLSWATWDSAARTLQAKITDEVIDEAVSALPPGFQPIDGPRLREALRERRDKIPEMARAYYRMLADQVDVHASDKADLAVVTRTDSVIDVAVSTRENPDRPYYFRRFYPVETSDIRIYLHGEADSAVAQGEGSGSTTVRFIGGGGDDAFARTNSASARFYDDRGTNRATGGSINTESYQAIADTTDPTALPHRDWGKHTVTYPIAAYAADAGIQFGVAGRITRWGFRHKPFRSEIRYSARVATGAGTGKVTFGTRFQRENSRSYLGVRAHLSGVEALRWYGFGNETVEFPGRSREFNRVQQHEFRIDPVVGWSLGERTLLAIGPEFKYSVTELDDGQNLTRFIGLDRPFGSETFGQLGAGLELTVDTRDLPTAPRRGLTVDLGGRAFPAWLDVEEPFAEVHGRVATYLSARMPTNPVLALQAGGKKVFGTEGKIPFHEAAFLGSSQTLRGFQTNRFAGDASLYGSAELRLHLTNLFIFMPGTQGVLGFFDGGRVYYEPEESSAWHHTFGGGIWLAFLTPGSLVSVTVGSSDEGAKAYVRVGFAF